MLPFTRRVPEKSRPARPPASETATPQTRNREHTETQTAPQRARHIAPILTLHTRERRKLNLTQSPNLASLDPFYPSNCPIYAHHLTVTKPLSRTQTILVPNSRTPRPPRNLTGRPRDFGIPPFRPGRAQPRPEGCPGLSPPERPPRPISTQVAPSPIIAFISFPLEPCPRALRASPGSGKT